MCREVRMDQSREPSFLDVDARITGLTQEYGSRKDRYVISLTLGR